MQNWCQNATPQEAELFLRFCQAHELDPFRGEAYFTKYTPRNGGPPRVSMVVGYHAWLRKGQASPRYLAHYSGVILDDGSMDEGQFIPPGKKLVGGWCDLYLKGIDRPMISRVNLNAYNTNQNVWKDNPAVMIRKVAIEDVFRQAFAAEFSGAYGSAEMGQAGAMIDEPQGPVVDRQAFVVDEPTQPAPRSQTLRGLERLVSLMNAGETPVDALREAWEWCAAREDAGDYPDLLQSARNELVAIGAFDERRERSDEEMDALTETSANEAWEDDPAPAPAKVRCVGCGDLVDPDALNDDKVCELCVAFGPPDATPAPPLIDPDAD